MGKIFSLPADVKAIVTDVLDDLLIVGEEGGFGKRCRLVYPGKQAPCENCIWDATTNRSSNRPRSGAPQPFAPGTSCPLCGGRGLKVTEVTEDIVFKCNWKISKDYVPKNTNLNVRVPHNVVRIKGFLTDLPKLLKAEYVIINLPLTGYVVQKYQLAGEPGDPANIVQNRYFQAYLERIL